MKKLLLLTAIIFSVASAYAQAPQKFNYQGAARDGAGKALASKTISMRISILDGSTPQYVETHTGVTTNAFGLFNVQIGGGTVQSGTMNGVTWSGGNKNIKVELDPNNGTAYTDLGTTQLLSVPYALYSNGPAGPQGPAGPTGPTGATGATGPAGSANMSGTTNYLIKFSGTTSGNNSALYQGSNNWIGMGTTSPTANVNVSTSDSMQLRLQSTYGSQASFGIVRVEYTGTTDLNHAGIIAQVTPNIAGTNGVGLLCVGGGQGIEARAMSSYSTTSSTVANAGIRGVSYIDAGTGYGVLGIATGYTTGATGTKYGVYGNVAYGTTAYAGYFNGNTHVNGTLSKLTGSFKIDHPLDPANKYLVHSFVESPDMMNVYNGNITTDASGLATVELPNYFETLNKDFRYQLTVIGTFAQAIVFKKVKDNQFVIKTNQPNVEVSWQVTGIRQDPYANAHRIHAEVEKEAENKGKYLAPVEHGKPITSQIGYMDIPTGDKLGEKATIK
jgi:hypothetical protein